MALTNDESRFDDTLINETVFEKYIVLGKLGQGTFGEVYKAVDIDSNQQVALKMENAPMPLLRLEYKLYQKLHTAKNTEGIPKVYQMGKVRDKPALVMERLGVSLQQLFEMSNKRLQLATVIPLALQMINRLKQFHQTTGYVHRDIKPDNFVLGYRQRTNIVHLIDYGLAARFWDSDTVRHVPHNGQHKMLVGTMRYASLNTHRGHTQSRRDDMESLGYTLIYLLRGSLPWQGVRASSRPQKYERIHEMKLSTPIEQLCHGLPETFAHYLIYCRRMRYSFEPEYHILRAMFYLLSCKHNISRDFQFHKLPELQKTKHTKTAHHSEHTCQHDHHRKRSAGDGGYVPNRKSYKQK
ncbi:hypothetical protein ZHAS_00008806 [Anopheles sinensis]|uniref:non-specific serine/threonine protein kinase n=1 Tax=Anopheles sinensis TaxID=74873 RepID=A0A084VTN0_ANOSI|nr:hypothetical protein ZHAS_00008806 [Anopheles sinensis]